jgi:hypothetical protein
MVMTGNRTVRWFAQGGLALLCLGLGSGCEIRQEMYDQPKYEPLAETAFFADRRASRPLVEGTIPQGYLQEDEHLHDGLVNGEPATTYPIPVTRETLLRGQERFNIYCSPCHDRVGTGNGIIVQRGFKQPVSYHIDRLREAPPGYFYGVIKNGFGMMASYSYQVPHPEDRWAIVAYIKALQLSQHATLDDVPEEERTSLQ